MKKTLATIMMITMIFTSMPLTSEAKTVHVKSITLTSVNAEVGEKAAIIMHVKPANATEKIQLGIYTNVEFPAKVTYKSKTYFKDGEIIGYATGTSVGSKTTQCHFYIYDGKKNRPTLSANLSINVTSPKSSFYDDEDEEEYEEAEDWDDEDWGNSGWEENDDEYWDYDDSDWDYDDSDWGYDPDWGYDDSDWSNNEEYDDSDWGSEEDFEYDDSEWEEEGEEEIEEDEDFDDEEEGEDKVTVLLIGNASIKSLKAGKKSFTVKVNQLASNKSDGYQVRYSLKKNMKKATTKGISSSNNKVSKKITKLKAKKTYYVQVRTIRKANGDTYYSEWSSTKKIKTK